MRIQIIYPIIALCCLATILNAQNPTKQQADYAYNALSYSSSANLYESMGPNSLNAPAKLRLADSYRLNGNTELAEYWYGQAVAEESSAKDILHYAQMLQSNGKCENALEQYNRYLNMVGAAQATPRAKVKDCAELDIKASNQVVIKNMESLNSAHLDFSPVPYKGGILFTSTRGQSSGNIIDQWTNDNFTDLFFAEKGIDGNLKSPILLQGKVNEAFHDGTATFDKSGTKIYFTRNSEGKNSKKIVELKIYSADLINGKWSNVQELNFNNKEYATCHPALSTDGRYLYFASNRPGGYGGMDLYVVQRIGDSWSEPQNLGPTINTPSNEIFPFIDKQSDLFFASDGHQGLGGLDIYVTKKEGSQWTDVSNLGAPYNSKKDDFGFSVLPNGREGYFSSSRAGGLGGDDIYHWNSDDVTANASTTRSIIAVIDAATGERIPEALVSIADAASNQGSETINFMTDGKGMISPAFSNGDKYTISVNKAGYKNYQKTIPTSEIKQAGEWIVALDKRSGKQLAGEIINKKYDRAIPNAVITLFNYCTGEKEKVLSDSEGQFTFFLECGCDFEVAGEKERFTKDKQTISTLNINCDDIHPINTTLYLNIGAAPITNNTVRAVPTTPSVNSTPPTVSTVPTTITTTNANAKRVISRTSFKNLSELSNNAEVLEGDVIVLDNLYYDYDKSYIRPEAADDLNKVAALMKKYPTMTLELLSHTDSRGKKEYNQMLSQERAEMAVRYLTSKGISRARLTAKGYGEERLRNHCEDNVSCDEAEHQANRRTEIRIIKR